ncbi:MAG: oligoribonuclease [Candidatus Nanopelagicaceae bacterium]|nr:oligoribonuclease [Candidatus Nanopelagicaceae bacterium]
MASENPPLIWIDCEMTGLSLEVDALVEIAVLVTDADLNIIGDGVDVVIHADPKQLAGMNDFVTQMHTTSGLIEEIGNGIDVATAEELILIYLQESGAQPGKSPLAGNSVSVDRSFIARDMPRLNEFLHYRTVDVSSIKELARRWHPRVYFNSPSKSGNHRALGDIKDSISELKYYRETIFVASPGPESKKLREVAQKYGPVQPEQVTTD